MPDVKQTLRLCVSGGGRRRESPSEKVALRAMILNAAKDIHTSLEISLCIPDTI